MEDFIEKTKKVTAESFNRGSEDILSTFTVQQMAFLESAIVYADHASVADRFTNRMGDMSREFKIIASVFDGSKPQVQALDDLKEFYNKTIISFMGEDAYDHLL